jgi:hypothetical protein
LSATFNCNVRKVKQCIKVNVHECDTQLKVPYYTIFTSDPEDPYVLTDRAPSIHPYLASEYPA